MKKLLGVFILSVALLTLGLIVADSLSADSIISVPSGSSVGQVCSAPYNDILITPPPVDPSVAEVCGASPGVKKGPDSNGKVSIKCFDPKGEWKSDGQGKIECKGELASSPGLYGEDSCSAPC